MICRYRDLSTRDDQKKKRNGTHYQAATHSNRSNDNDDDGARVLLLLLQRLVSISLRACRSTQSPPAPDQPALFNVSVSGSGPLLALLVAGQLLLTKKPSSSDN